MENYVCLNCFTLNPEEYCCGEETEVFPLEEIMYLVNDLRYKDIVDVVIDTEEEREKLIIREKY